MLNPLFSQTKVVLLLLGLLLVSSVNAGEPLLRDYGVVKNLSPYQMRWTAKFKTGTDWCEFYLWGLVHCKQNLLEAGESMGGKDSKGDLIDVDGFTFAERKFRTYGPINPEIHEKGVWIKIGNGTIARCYGGRDMPECYI